MKRAGTAIIFLLLLFGLLIHASEVRQTMSLDHATASIVNQDHLNLMTYRKEVAAVKKLSHWLGLLTCSFSFYFFNQMSPTALAFVIRVIYFFFFADMVATNQLWALQPTLHPFQLTKLEKNQVRLSMVLSMVKVAILSTLFFSEDRMARPWFIAVLFMPTLLEYIFAFKAKASKDGKLL